MCSYYLQAFWIEKEEAYYYTARLDELERERERDKKQSMVVDSVE